MENLLEVVPANPIRGLTMPSRFQAIVQEYTVLLLINQSLGMLKMSGQTNFPYIEILNTNVILNISNDLSLYNACSAIKCSK